MYSIFTVTKGTVYLIYGWVQLTDITNEVITLMQTYKGRQMTIEKRKGEKKEIFFFQKALLADNSTISVHLKSAYKDSLFHLYELWPVLSDL